VKTLVIEPRDSLLVRDARPFSRDPGARARSLDFPFPSTLAGAVRTRLGCNSEGVFQPEKRVEVLKLAVRGPLLCRLDEAGKPGGWLLPAPADAVLFEGVAGALRRERLAPLELPEGARTDLDPELLPLGLGDPNPAKPAAGPPRFWHWQGASGYQAWLQAPASGSVQRADLGLAGLTREARVHVSVSRDTGTAEEGRLFSTEGLRFSVPAGEGEDALASARLGAMGRFALALGVAHPNLESLQGIAPLAGERRLCAWRPQSFQWPSAPEALEKALLKHRAARLLLLTPGLFEKGWCPAAERLGPPGTRLVAAAVRRPEVVSGWDLAISKPKPSRRAAPAGSVYFLRLPAQMPEADLKAWLRQHWLGNLCDQEQDNLDGFGLHLVGAWDGQTLQMSGRVR